MLALLASPGLAQTTQQLTIEDIFTGAGPTGRPPETVKWSPDGKKVSFVQRDEAGEHGALYYVDVATGQKAVLVTEQKLATLAPPISHIKSEIERERVERYSVAAYHWAPDSKHLLFDANGQLWLYSLDTQTAVQLTASSDPSGDPTFAPDGKTIAFLRKHNLFIRPAGSDGNEKALTNDTDPNILNGEVDWVYAEELDVRHNYFWSPDSKELVFLQMNEKPVPTYPISDFIPVHATVDQQKYPQPGDPNPEVRVGMISAKGGGVKWFEVGKPEDREYIPRFGWIRDGLIYIEVLNRSQKKLDLYFVDTKNGKSQLMLSDREPDAWVEVNDDFQVLKSGDQFLWNSWRDGYHQLYLYSFDKQNPLNGEGKLVRQLTNGQFEVSGVEGVDEATRTVYFSANPQPLEHQIYAVKLTGGEMQKVSREEGTHHAEFSPGANYYVDTFSALMTPGQLSLCKNSGTCNAPFWKPADLRGLNLTAPKFVQFKAADNTTTLYGLLLMPPNATSAAPHSIPIIMDPYGGPGAQSVTDSWGGSTYLFHDILAHEGYAILIVDNRGMSGRGKQFARAAMGHFGKVELADQLASLDQALAGNPQFDPDRIGWWGWSYGGYMTLYSMTHTNRIKAGVAVAPVSDWRLYDSIYTERYMGVPKDNEEGYKNSSPVNFAKDLNGRLMIAHGTSDDNVHPQNTILMIQNLIAAHLPYDLQLYPRKTHGIAGKDARIQLFDRIKAQFETWLPVNK
jgi:dipeptidyl-peptidase-4